MSTNFIPNNLNIPMSFIFFIFIKDRVDDILNDATKIIKLKTNIDPIFSISMETLPMILKFKDIGMVFFINVFIIIIAGISVGKKFLNHDPLELLKWVK